jgi:hypothetical protein
MFLESTPDGVISAWPPRGSGLRANDECARRKSRRFRLADGKAQRNRAHGTGEDGGLGDGEFGEGNSGRAEAF